MSKTTHFLLTIVLLCAAINCVAREYEIHIRDQESFNRIQSLIHAAKEKGEKDIRIVIEPGQYFFTNYHVRLVGLDWPDVSLFITGNECTITSEGEDLKNGDYLNEFDTGKALISADGNLLDWFGKSYKCKMPIEIVDLKDKICKVFCNGLKDRDESECQQSYIKLTRWYTSSTYRIHHIKNNRIFFIAHDLKRENNLPYGFNVNDDLFHGQMLPRFRLCNVGDTTCRVFLESGKLHLLDNNSDQVHICSNGCFLDIADVNLKSLTIQGIKFQGNSTNANPALMRIERLSCSETDISRCHFEFIRSHIFHAREMESLYFHDNLITDCPGFGIVSDIRTSGTRIDRNTFRNTGKDYKPTFCIQVAGDDYYIANNTFHNFGYSAIAIGLGPYIDYDGICHGVVENNLLYYDDEYITSIDDYGLMDSGAIYLTTRHDGAIVRNNVIRNIGGIKDNRGIFCDDGARNFSICDNVIIGTRNSYSIDSRRVDAFEEVCGPANVNNKISGNIVDSGIRFEGLPGNNDCYLGVNYLLKRAGDDYPSIATKNIANPSKQVRK